MEEIIRFFSFTCSLFMSGEIHKNENLCFFTGINKRKSDIFYPFGNPWGSLHNILTLTSGYISCRLQCKIPRRFFTFGCKCTATWSNEGSI